MYGSCCFLLIEFLENLVLKGNFRDILKSEFVSLYVYLVGVVFGVLSFQRDVLDIFQECYFYSWFCKGYLGQMLVSVGG